MFALARATTFRPPSLNLPARAVSSRTSIPTPTPIPTQLVRPSPPPPHVTPIDKPLKKASIAIIPTHPPTQHLQSNSLVAAAIGLVFLSIIFGEGEEDNQTKFEKALSTGDAALLNELIDKGVEVDKYGLWLIASKSPSSVGCEFLSKHTLHRVREQDQLNHTPLFYAVQGSYVENVRILADSNAIIPDEPIRLSSSERDELYKKGFETTRKTFDYLTFALAIKHNSREEIICNSTEYAFYKGHEDARACEVVKILEKY